MRDVKPVIIGEIGSFAHGLNVATSDHDCIGLYLDEPEVLIGNLSARGSVQMQDRPEGTKALAGEVEGTFYGVRHYAYLAAQGNPTVLTLLFTPNLFHPDEIGLQHNRKMFLSKLLVDKHIGYANSMEAQLTGAKAPRTNRPELIAEHGFDTKASMHALRLLLQGRELLHTGHMTMPMVFPHRNYLMDVREGYFSKDDVLEDIAHLRIQIEDARETTTLPELPDYARINAWLIEIHANGWGFWDE